MLLRPVVLAVFASAFPGRPRLIAPRPSVHADGYLEFITDNGLLKMGPASSFQGIEPDVTKEVRACSNRPDTWSDICVTHACSPSALPSSPWGPPPRSRGRHSPPRPPRPSISSPSVTPLRPAS